jgi:DNA-binding GntR family transcriptional regulator
MSDNSTATVNVPTELLKPIIQAKVVEALGGERALLGDFVKAILERKVRRDYQERSFIEDACLTAIETAVKDAARQWCEESVDALREAVKRDLSRRSRSIATELVNGFVAASKNQYQMSVALSVQPTPR